MIIFEMFIKLIIERKNEAITTINRNKNDKKR